MKFKIINEQAMKQNDAMNRCMDLSMRFIEHFDKIYNDIDNTAINHWASEMQSWLDNINNIKLKNTNKNLSIDKKIDWFFTCGSDAETLFKNNMTEADVYNDFIELVIKTNDIKQSLKELDLMN